MALDSEDISGSGRDYRISPICGESREKWQVMGRHELIAPSGQHAPHRNTVGYGWLADGT